MKPYAEQTSDERIASLDKQLNILVDPDWAELAARFQSEAADLHKQMDEAPNWETFVAARAVHLYVERLLKLRELVQSEKDDLEADQVTLDEPLPPTDYEVE
jgi:hypothetical protein